VPSDISTERKIMEILQIMRESGGVIGSRTIADKLNERGYSISERGVRYYLNLMDKLELTKKVGQVGRIISEKGMKELEEGFVGYRVGFILSKIEELIYNTTFDIINEKGDVIANISYIDKDRFEEFVELINSIPEYEFIPTRKVAILDEDDVFIPEGKVGIATVCSMTFDGVLVKKGIPVNVMYGGVLRIVNRRPAVFEELMGYRGVSMDPMEVFLARKLTSVSSVIQHGEGCVLANIREVPCTAHEEVVKIIESMRKAGISGVAGISECGEPIFGVSTSQARVSIVVYAGLNIMALVEETGIDIQVFPVSIILNISRFREL